MSGSGWGKPGPSSGGGSSNGVGGRTTSGSMTGIGWFGCGVVGNAGPFFSITPKPPFGHATTPGAAIRSGCGDYAFRLRANC
jgi:hypothetical protein